MRTAARPSPCAGRGVALTALLVLVTGLLSGCDIFNPDPPVTPFVSINPAGPVTLEAGQTLSIRALTSSGATASFFSEAPAVATVTGDLFNGATVQAVAPGTTRIVAGIAGAVAYLEVTVTAPAGPTLPTGVFGLPFSEPEALLMLINGPGRAFANLPGTFVAAVSGADGFAAVDLQTNAVVHDARGVPGGPFFGVAAASQSPAGPSSSAAFVAFGQNGWVLQNYTNGAFGLPQAFPPRVYDAYGAGGGVEVDIIGLTESLLRRGRFVRYDPSAGFYTPTSEFLPTPAAEGEPVSAFVRDDADTPPAPVLFLTRSTDSGLLLDRRDGTGPVRALSLGLDSRKIRCAPVTSGGVVCGVTVFGEDRVALVRWDGTNLPTLAGSFPAGDGPVDLSLFRLSGGTFAFATSGFSDGTITEAEVSPTGEVVSSQTRAAPAGCTNPGHVVHVRDGAGLKLVGTCYGSANYFITPSRF